MTNVGSRRLSVTEKGQQVALIVPGAMSSAIIRKGEITNVTFVKQHSSMLTAGRGIRSVVSIDPSASYQQMLTLITEGCRYCPKCKVTFKLKSDFQQHQFDVHNIGRGAAPSQPPANVDKEHRSWDAQIEIAETSARKSAGRYKQEERREGRGIEGIYLEQDSDSALSDIEIDNGDTGELQSASPNDHQRSFASKFHSSKVAKDFDKSAQKKVEKKKEPESKDSAVIDEGCEHDDEITCNACLRKRKLQALVQRQEDSERKPKKRSSMTVETQA